MDILRNLSLLPLSGVLKSAFKDWMKLPDLNDVNHLAKYGFINDDTNNRKISLHFICLAHGLDVKRPQNIIDSLISITERIIVDMPDDFLLFLQDMFPYLDKYLVSDYLPKLVSRIEYVMDQKQGDILNQSPSHCDRALLLDYKAELFVAKKDYGNALKKRLRAVSILEPFHTSEADLQTASLLSNLYNNLSNVYLLMKKPKEAADALRTALAIRKEYAHLGLSESHDMLQQMMNLTNMLILSKNSDMAK